jgi:hypothetical protein
VTYRDVKEGCEALLDTILKAEGIR